MTTLLRRRLKKQKREPPSLARIAFRQGYTLLEIMISMAIMTFLAALLLSATKSIVEDSRAGKCVSHLRQFFMALQSYAADHQNRLPPYREFVPQPDGTTKEGDSWRDLVEPYLPGVPVNNRKNRRTIDICPSGPPMDKNSYNFYYGLTFNSTTDAQRNCSAIATPSRYFLLGDSGGAMRIAPGSSATDFAFRHGGKANLVFLDGHAESRRLAEIPPNTEKNSPAFKQFWNGE